MKVSWDFFFYGGRSSNLKPFIYYILSLPTELNSWGQWVGTLV